MWHAAWQGIKWLLDWYGRLQAAPAIYAFIAGVAMTAYGVIAGAPGWALVLLFLAACLVVLGSAGLLQHWHARKSLSNAQQLADILYPPVPWYKRLWWKLTFQTEESRADKAFDERMRKERISFRFACRILYEHLRAAGSVYAAAAEHEWGIHRQRGESQEARVLGFMASFLKDKVPFYGKFPPSTTVELIEASKLRILNVDAGQNSLTESGGKSPQYVDLEVDRSEVMKVVNEYKHKKFDS